MQRNQPTRMTWDEFKAFLRKSLKESNAFVSHIWIKLRGDIQHLLKEVQDWATHLKHFLSILLEFDTNYGPRGVQLGCTFYDGVKWSTSKPIPTSLQVALVGMLSINGRSLNQT